MSKHKYFNIGFERNLYSIIIETLVIQNGIVLIHFLDFRLCTNLIFFH